MVSFYDPTWTAYINVIADFYQGLDNILSSIIISRSNRGIFLDDFNVRAGKDFEQWLSVLGKNGFLKTNYF